MKFQNLSNGKSDGFVLFYLKDGKLHSVLLNEDAVDVLDATLGCLNAVNGNKTINITKCDKSVVMGML